MNNEKRCPYCNKNMSVTEMVRGSCKECDESLYAERIQTHVIDDELIDDELYEGLLDPTERLWKPVR